MPVSVRMLLCVAGGRCVPLQEVEELIGVSNSSGDKSINTILVRPSHKGAPPSLSDHLNQKDKSFTSAWAQIMELEGYRSAAIGLDNKYDAKVSINDSDGSASKLIGESHQKYTQTYMKSSQYENECNDSDSKSCENQNIRHFEICDINLSTDCRKKDSHQTDASYPTPNKSDETSKRCVSVDTKLKPLRTRASKLHSRNRRKTLPDNSLKSPSKDLRSPEHDPNASWGRYNSRAMRDSVLKVAEKYAEIVHLRRQTRLKLDSVSEGIQLSKYSPFSSSKISDSESILNLEDKLHTKILSTTNYMPEIPTISLKKLGQMPAKDRRSDRTKFTVDLVSMDLSNDRVSNNSSRIERIKIPPSGNLEFGMFGNSYAAFSSSKCIKGSNISPAFPLSSSNKLHKKNPSIDCKIAYDKSSPAYHFTCTQELKTKLCADCAKSTNEAPPIKQPSCRSNFGFSSIPLLKPLCNEESQLNATPVSSKKPASRKCTMLSAQEMAELVHGTNSLKAEDSKVSQTKVTKIVSSWIQKQKTKRKPVFFIGDPDSCHETHVKGRMSRRSLSLTSVREGEVSLHTNGGPLEDQSIKRASSICGQRGDLFRSLFRNRRKPQNCENVFANPWFRKSDSESSMIGKSNAKLQKEDAEKTSPKIFPLKQINRALSLKKKSNDQNFHVSKCHCEVKAVLKKHSFLTRSASLSWPLSKQNIQSAHPLQNKGRHLLDGKLDMNRTPLEYTNSAENENNATNLDMALRTNPVKLCGAHSRLLICHNKGRYRLRRSVSQPVELEMTGSIHNLKESLHGSADQDNFQKSSQLSSEDEGSSESDIYHSYCCSPTDHSNTCWESGDGNIYAEALWEHETLDSEELPFQAGDRIEVTDTSDQDWWWGTKDGLSGWFPSAFVRLYVSRGGSVLLNGQESEDIQVPFSPCKVNINNLSSEQVRANIVLEIVATERDYVKHLKDVVEGYLKQVHRRPDMFSVERIETVFGNIKEIFSFQSQFLQQLEECLDIDSPHLSQIGKAFLNHKEDFKMYSQYCNNHPLAVSELQELYCDSQYIHFFEACRLLQEMIDISLDGFLLTPIQRICKYPLQLAELLKFTDVDHPDHVPVTNALAAMKEVAELVNERKRRMECLERIAEWQNTIEGWEGPDVLDTSSLLIHCGEVTRESSSWSRDIYLFLFDHQLIYCKKDLLKRHTYAYKGRLNLDHCDIVDVEDGKDSQFAVNVKNAWKLFSKDKDKWYLFYTKTTLEKEQWLDAFKSERQIVSDDEKQAFIVTEEAKRCARLAVQNKQKPKRPRAKFTKGRRCHPDVAVTELLLDSPSAKSRSGSLPSNIHPEFAIMAGSKLGPTRKKGSGWFHFGSGKKPKS